MRMTALIERGYTDGMGLMSAMIFAPPILHPIHSRHLSSSSKAPTSSPSSAIIYSPPRARILFSSIQGNLQYSARTARCIGA